MQLSKLEKANIKNLMESLNDSVQDMFGKYMVVHHSEEGSDDYEHGLVDVKKYLTECKGYLKEIDSYLGVDNDLDNV